MVRTLPRKNCLALGRAVVNLPVKVEVAQMDTVTLGQTRLFFESKKELLIQKNK
jgi:hypothetical protein